MFKVPRLHLRLGQRFVLVIKLYGNIACPAQAARRWNFSSLGRFPLLTSGSGPLLAMEAPSTPLPLGKRVSVSPNTAPKSALGWASPLGSPLSPPSLDTRYGVATNIRVGRADAGSSGRGAGHQINTAFFIQSCIGTDCSVSCQEMLEWKVFGD